MKKNFAVLIGGDFCSEYSNCICRKCGNNGKRK